MHNTDISNTTEKEKKKINATDVYVDLGPKDDLEDDNASIQALDWAISRPGLKGEEKKRITNIALTGPYGSGKSSVINSYLNSHDDVKNKSIKLSLGKFDKQSLDELDHKGSDGVSECTPLIQQQPKEIKDLEKSAEGTILKQLMYMEKPYTTPRSRYRRLHKTNFKFAIILTLIVIGFIISGSYILYKTIDTLKNGQTLPTPFIVCEVIYFLSLAAFIAKIISTPIPRTSISRISFGKKIAIESSSNKDSIYNKYLDEIIYFFECTKYEYVFIEDLDRFENPNLFSHLRELNLILNHSKSVERRIVFVYAIKDDLFKDTDRTKFFDFIIPVVPVVGNANAKGIISKRAKAFQKIGIDCGIDEAYINNIAPFVTEMRTIINIFNEFALYKEMIIDKNLRTLDNKQLFSLIVLKNMDVDEFSKLENDESIINQIFELKNKDSNTVKTDMGDFIKNSSDAKILLKNHGILHVLLSYNYIDEEYDKYLTLFNGQNISNSDMEFIQATKLNKELRYDYKLDNVEEVVKYLNAPDYESSTALNIHLVNYLLSGSSDIEARTVILQSHSKPSSHSEFTNLYLREGENPIRFLEIIKNASIKLGNIEWDKISEECKKKIIDDNLYLLRRNTMIPVIKYLDKNKDIYNDDEPNIYDSIRLLRDKIDKDLIDKNIIEFINNVICVNGKNYDSLDAIKEMLSLCAENEEISMALVSSEQTKINNINELYDTENIKLHSATVSKVYSTLFRKYTVYPNWENLYFYYVYFTTEFTKDESIEKYIEKYIDELVQSDTTGLNSEFINCILWEKIPDKLWMKAFKCFVKESSKIDIERINEKHALQILSFYNNVPSKWFQKMWNLLDEKNREQMIYKYKKVLDLSDFALYFDELPYFEDLRILKGRHKGQLEYNQNNFELILHLEEKRYITSKEIKENRISFWVKPGMEIIPERFIENKQPLI